MATRFTALAVLILLTSTAAAQWSVVDRHPANPIVAADALILHDDGTALRARAVPGEAWIELAPTGVAVLGVADHLALFEHPDGVAVFDARSGRVAPLAVAAPLETRVERELALVLVELPGGELEAHAWSARGEAWASIALGPGLPDPFDVVSDDGVVVIRRPDGYAGFGAVSGTWATLGVPVAGDYALVAGHVGGAPLFDPATQLGEHRYAAFSGHRGAWSVSDPLHFSSIPRFARDSVAVRLESAITMRFFPSAFDGLRGLWINGPQIHVSTSPIDYVTAHLHWLEDPAEGVHFDYFGPLTGEGWRVFDVPHETVVAAEDHVLAIHGASGSLLGWSALVGGEPLDRPSSAPVEVVASNPSISVVRDAAGTLHAFLARANTWAPPLPLVGVTGSMGAAGRGGVLASGSDEVFGLGATGSDWVPLGAGSGADELIVASELLAARLGDRLWFFDAAFELWWDGGTLSAGESLVVADDHLLAIDEAAGSARAWAAARPGWQVGEPVAFPLAEGPVAQGRISRFVDGQGRLHVFGGGASLEPIQRWPLEPDPALRPELVDVAARVTLALTGAPGEAAVLFLAATADPGGLELPGVSGLLQLGPSALQIEAVGPLGDDGVERSTTPIPAGIPSGIGLWLQSALLDVGEGTARFGAGVARVEVR